jgi:predicted histone-like DNA-binding protein
MPLIYKPYQATLANKEGQKLYYPRLVKFGKMAELIAEKASLTAGDVHNVIRNLMSVMREQLLNSRTVRLEGLGTFTMIAKAGGKGVELESKVSSSQITSLRCQFTPEYTRAANGSATRALTTGVEFVHIKDVAGSFVADDVVDKDPDDGDEPGGGGGEAPDPAA